MENAFYGAENMRMSATDAPDLSAVGTMRSMFRATAAFNQDIGGWDVSNVRDMESMFFSAAAFNQDIGGWDVGNVRNMGFMFFTTDAFNQDIGDWDVGNVTNMAAMFAAAAAFNQDIGRWTVDSVTNMADMFNGAAAFNQDIGSWTVNSVTNMAFMFRGAAAFNGNIGRWDVGDVEYMGYMFNGAAAFNQDISRWDVGNVTNMDNMFNGADAFSQNLGRWYIAGTPNPGYDGATDFVVLRLAAQSALLDDQAPVYALVAGDGDSDNNEFTLTGAALSANTGVADGSYKVRIGASGVLFGAANAVMVDVTVGDAAALSGLMLSAGALSPAFASDTISYTASVANAVTSITITPTLNAVNASVTVNGAAVVSGEASGAISLAVGETEIQVVVTAEDTTTKRTYTLVITRAVDTTVFVTTWRATANDTTILFPGGGRYTIDWGDGSAIASATDDVGHTYAAAGDYDITVSSAIVRFSLKYSADRGKLIDIKQWGDAQWNTMENAFHGAANMRMSATDAPNLSAVRTMRSMFYGAAAFNQDIGGWDVGNVTDMAGMFSRAAAFNGDIGGWDVSNVTNMRFMFYDASAFNQDISGWNVGNVTNISYMFSRAAAFNGNIGGWDVSNAKDMSYMFDGAAFNQDIGGWNVGNVTNMDRMFNDAAAFNQGIGGWDVGNVTDMDNMFNGAAAFNQDIGDWDVGDVTNMGGMFRDAHVFNQDIGGWDVGNVTDMDNMFYRAAAFNQDIGGWDMGDVTNMEGMFNGAAAFSQNLGRWYIAGTPNLSYDGITNLVVLRLAAQNSVLTGQGPVYALAAGDGDSDNNEFDLITAATGAALSAKAGTAAGDYSVRIGASGVLFGAANAAVMDVAVGATDAALSGLALSAGALSPAFASGALTYAASVANAVESITVTPTLNDANASVTVNGAAVVSGEASGAISLAVGGTEIQVVVTAEDAKTERTYTVAVTRAVDTTAFITTWRATANDVITFPGEGAYAIDWGDGSAIETATGAVNHTYAAAGAYDIAASSAITRFHLNNGADKEKLIDIKQWGGAQWSSMEGAFHGAENMRMSATDAPNLSAVRTMRGMFQYAFVFNGAIGGWDVSNVKNMKSMFFEAFVFNQDIGGWDVGNVTNMFDMFFEAYVFNQDIGGWNVSNVRNMGSMFTYAEAFNQDIGGWDVGNVTNMAAMFFSALAFNGDISGWDVGNVTNMFDMFFEAYVFNQDIGGWNVSNVRNMGSMFSYALAFNQDIGGWNVGNVRSMEDMFFKAYVFNQDIGTWDVGKVTNMDSMFNDAAAFDQDIGGWDVGNVKNMIGMFNGAAAFNQDIGGWDVGNVQYMDRMFNGAAAFSQNLGRWYIAGTPNPDYDGATDFVVFRFAAQNSVLTGQGPVYALAAGDGGDDNDKFTLTGAALSANTGVADGSYKVRIGASDVLFGDDNAIMVDVTVGAADAALSGLALSAGVLSPSFVSYTIGYTARVANAVTSITVTPTLNDANARVTVAGAAVASGAASGAISLAVGETEIQVVVTAADATTVRTYTLAVARAVDTTAFITTWRTTTANDAITFPGVGAYTIDWGDGSAIDTATGAVNHTYAAVGDYDIAASSAITRFNLNHGEDREKLIDIKQWGGARWNSMGSAFYGAENMRMSAADAPDLSVVGAMSDMFRDASAFNGDISGWDVGNVADMAGMFGGAAAFNGDIGGWDVGKVIDMIDMFNGAAAVSQNLGRWYIVGTPKPGYDGADNLVALNLAAQNSVLTGQGPVYALAAGAGDDDNDKFTLTGAALSAKAGTAAGDYSVRIGASDVDFGAANARAITVAVPASSVASLSALTLSADALTPVFDSATLTYTARVANAVDSITVTPTLNDANASVTADDAGVVSGEASGAISLAVGETEIQVVVTAEDAETERTYTVTVTRVAADAADDASLSGLALSAGVLDPAFASDAISYTARVANAVDSITVTPTLNDANASVTVDGEAVASGEASGAISLAVGETEIQVVVTAEDAETERTYTVTVTRVAADAADDASLRGLALSAGVLDPAFASDATIYTANVANAVDSITVTPTLNDANASVTADGAAVASGAASGAISLAVGETEIQVVVTAEDAETTQTYTVTVTRVAADADASLSGLTLSAGALTPAFASDAISYTANVANAVDSITVTPTLNDANASVTVAGATVVSGAASGAISLAVGETEIKVVVTAADATTTQTYTVAVARAVDTTAFITTWRATANDAITFPGEGAYTIDWGTAARLKPPPARSTIPTPPPATTTSPPQTPLPALTSLLAMIERN
ncbi:BspA family leucine-rich repeat surface protein [Candidatus Spongiihabitans sp.]|uniref:BspA family leucine-rich repeat surface protein n=1 Tax=Candidatus Spongiihabitans sp. TaxID=3101308 RepID=UPI003C701298